uniref:Gamma-crystallin M3-like n=1 Tax=Gadus morhua TaxID=8049 RepID=A0A8C5FK63_GADMO
MCDRGTSSSASAATSSVTMGRITFYEDKNFQGRSYDCSSDCSDFSGHLSRSGSCRVESGCFMAYERPAYAGSQVFLRRGEYPDFQRMSSMSGMMGMTNMDNVRSCRFIPMHRGQFRMRIYEKENFGGQMHEMTDDCDNMMERYRMSECQSCNVMDGHWLMYEQPNYRGRMMYMKPGEYRNMRDMGMSGSTRFNSFRRITDSC